jgi:MFS family permease
VYYITSVLEQNVGLTRNLSLLLGGVINLMFFIGSLVPTFTLDKTGRRKPMMWGSLGCGASMMMIAILLSFQPGGGNLAKATASGSVAFFFTVCRCVRGGCGVANVYRSICFHSA